MDRTATGAAPAQASEKGAKAPVGRRPGDLAFPGLRPDDLCLRVDEGTYGEVQDASNRTRGQAISFFASEAGCNFIDVRCTVRYVRLFTRQDVWDGPGKDRWVDDSALPFDEAWKQVPAVPAVSWTPDELMPCWEFCDRKHPAAVRVYICEERPRPKAPVAGSEAE